VDHIGSSRPYSPCRCTTTSTTVAALKDGCVTITKVILVYPSDEVQISFNIEKTNQILTQAFSGWFIWIDRILGKHFDIGPEGLDLRVGGGRLSVPYPVLEIQLQEKWEECKFEQDAQLWWECKHKTSGGIAVKLSIDFDYPFGDKVALVIGGPGAVVAYDYLLHI